MRKHFVEIKFSQKLRNNIFAKFYNTHSLFVLY